REGVDSRIFLPAILIARRAVAHDEREGTADHVSDLDAIQRAVLLELRGEQHGKCRLVELHAGPVRAAAEPLVLIPMAVGELRRAKVAQRVESLADRPYRKEGARAFAEVTRPDEVISLPLLLGVAPGDAEARHHRPLVGLVEM